MYALVWDLGRISRRRLGGGISFCLLFLFGKEVRTWGIEKLRRKI